MISVFSRFLRQKQLYKIMAPTSSIHISVVGTGRPGSPKSILICTDSTRYLVNCGEGTQRIVTEHKSKASRIHHVFFTRMSWDYFSGLLGIALTVKVAGVKRMLVHGPSTASQLMKLTRHFADASTTDVAQSDILQKPFVDNDFKITAVELKKPVESPQQNPKRPHLDPSRNDGSVYAYFFQPFKANNKVDIAKCRELDIPDDVMRSGAIRKLIAGESIVLEDNRTILPKDVTVSSPIPQNLLVIECPSEAHIPVLMGADSLYAALSSPDETIDRNGEARQLYGGVGLTVHFVPPGLFKQPEYQEFVRSLDKYATAGDGSKENNSVGVKHLVLDGQSSCPPVYGIYSQSSILSKYFDSTIYPLLADLHLSKRESQLASVEPFSSVVVAEPLIKCHLRPNTGFSTEQCIVLDEEALLENAFDPLYVSEEEASSAFKKMKDDLAAALVERLKAGTQSKLEQYEWPEFTFLGTASSSPSKYRNISGILVRLSPDTCILMDCGEGTLNQLYALYGVEETHRQLRGLKLIVITHMHADHHGGVLTIGKKVEELCPGYRLPVLAPSPFWKWTQSFAELFGEKACIQFFSINKLYKGSDDLQSAEILPKENFIALQPTYVNPLWSLRDEDEEDLVKEWNQLLTSLRLKIGPVRVPHTGTSWGFVFEHLEGSNDEEERTGPWKVVYSGDTPPCEQLAEAGRDCDLLIHEATMADGYEEQAVVARHSTTSEAISIGRLMKAKFLLLHHFSQRFSVLPNFDTFQKEIAPTFDFMRVKFGDLWKLPYFLPYYKYAFAKHWDTQKTRTDARISRKQHTEQEMEQSRAAVRDAIGS